MTDINFKNELSTISDDELFLKSTELLYFAYRDFIAWPDEGVTKIWDLAALIIRVLFFVSQNPGYDRSRTT